MPTAINLEDVNFDAIIGHDIVRQNIALQTKCTIDPELRQINLADIEPI